MKMGLKIDVLIEGTIPVLFLFLMALSSTYSWAGDDIYPERKMELVKLVRNDCGSCHGARLSGGLGPSLLKESLRGKVPEGLRETILRGRTGTAMPPWSNFMTSDEADWIVERLMEGFPDAH